jgi:hypothetical protein
MTFFTVSPITTQFLVGGDEGAGDMVLSTLTPTLSQRERDRK